VLNNPVNLTDPSGHVCVNGSGDDEVAMAGNCGGAPNPNYDGGLLGSSSGWTGNKGGTKYHENPTYGNGLIGPPAPPTYGNGLIGPPINQPHTGYSNRS
jgi:hypothetical protein